MTENDYLYQIQICKNQIDDYIYNINRNTNKIKDLERFRNKLENILAKESTLSENGKIQIGKLLTSSFSCWGSILNVRIFQGILDIYQGVEFENAINSLREAIKVTLSNIDFLKEEIKTYNHAVNDLNSQIKELNYQISLLASQSEGSNDY